MNSQIKQENWTDGFKKFITQLQTPSKLKTVSNKVDFKSEDLIEELIVNFKGIEYGVFVNYDLIDLDIMEFEIIALELCLANGDEWTKPIPNNRIFRELEESIFKAVENHLEENIDKFQYEMDRQESAEWHRAEVLTNNFSR